MGHEVERGDRTGDRRSEYLAINLANWEARVPVHLGPDGYDLDAYVADPDKLSDVVKFDLPRLGDVAGKRVVHLQCHLGTDTVSLARLGARVAGLDFSPSALIAARDFADACGVEIDFVEADVYAAVEVFGSERFDLVYTGIGAISWLPSIERWAQTVAGLLVEGGELFIRDGHPLANACSDPRPDGLIAVEYPYFDVGGTVFVNETSYAGDGTELASQTTVDFNHGLAEIFNALWNAGMQVSMFVEHDTAPWQRFGDQMERLENGEFRLIEHPERLPMTFTIRARKASAPHVVDHGRDK